MSQVEFYESDEDEEVREEVLGSSKKEKIKIQRLWVQESTFENKLEADNFVKGENCWGFGASSESENGKKHYFRCNLVKARGVQCAAKIYLLFHASSTDITLFRASDCHTHDVIETKASSGLSEEVKEKIEELWQLGIKPKRILEEIGKLNFQLPPTARQLSNFIGTLNKKRFGQSKISLGDVESWCSSNNDVPEDEDKPFVAGYEVVVGADGGNENNLFRFFVTTKRLIQTSLLSDKLHADATYKLIWQGFPVIVCGTTDMGRHFHHFGVSVCVNERQEDFAFVFKTLKEAVQKIYSKDLDFDILISDAAGKIKRVFFLISF